MPPMRLPSSATRNSLLGFTSLAINEAMECHSLVISVTRSAPWMSSYVACQVSTSNARTAARSRSPAVRTNMLLLDAQLGLDEVVDGLRIGLAASRLHHLADEPAGHGGLGASLLDLAGI